jgi:purine-binding chemotaxis protein CheW
LPGGEFIRYLQFQLDGEWYVHDIAGVREVVLYENPSPVPGGAEGLLGLVEIRGRVVSVFSGRDLLRRAPPEDPARQKIVVFDIDRGVFGVTVDEVAGILALNPEELDRASAADPEGVVRGTLNHADDLLILVDFRRCRTLQEAAAAG